MAQDHGLCRKKKSQNGPVHGPPLQARVAAANGTVLAACKLLALTLQMILVHMEGTGGKQNTMD